MKRLKFVLLLLIAALLCFAAAACTQPEDLQKLPAPQNLHMEGAILVWDEEENASGYAVSFEGREYTVPRARYDLSSLSAAGEYTVAVRALGDGAAYADSDWAEFVYVITAGREEPEVVPTAGLAYSLMPGGKSWEVSRGKADLRGTVVIPDYYEGLPVVRVADEGFGGDGTLDSFRNTVTTGVALPETLVEIGDYAFGNCTALKEIVIPDGVVSLGRGVFDEDEDLLRAVLPSSLSEIPDRLFFGCTALYDVSIPATAAVKVIGGGAFRGCEDLTSVEIPSSVESIGAGAFASCSGLTAVELPASVTSIGASAFANCSGISSFTVPAGVTRLENYLFYECSSLSEITFPAQVSYVGDLVFRGTAWLERQPGPVYLVGNVLAAYPVCAPGGGEVVVPSGTVISQEVFAGTNVRSVTIEDGCTLREPASLFEGAAALQEVDLPSDFIVGINAFRDCSSLASVSLAEGITQLGSNAFYGCSSLEELVFPESITQFGSNAFYGCSSLRELVFPEDAELDVQVFSGNTALERIVLPRSISSLPMGFFGGCTALLTVELPAGITALPNSLFSGCSSLTGVTFLGEITSIGRGAFADCTSLRSFTVPEGAELGKRVFEGCSSLTGITLPAGLTALPERIFAGAGFITTAEAIPEGIVTVGRDAFEGCASLREIVFPSTLQEIETNAFKNCTALESAVIPGGMTLGTLIYARCTALTSVTVEEEVTVIPAGTFNGCTSLQFFAAPEGVAEIGGNAFTNCSSLAEVLLPASLTRIYVTAFDNCTALASVYYAGTPEQWLLVSGTDVVGSAEVSFYAAEQADIPAGSTQAYWHYGEDGLPVLW